MNDFRPNNLVYFDWAREMFARAAEDDKVHDCAYAVAIVITKDGEILSGEAYDEETMRPFAMVGALEMVKREVMGHIA